MNTKNILSLLLIFATALLLGGCDENQWSEDYDIEWPVTSIQEVSSNDVMVSDVVTITGELMDKGYKVYLGGQACEIVEGSVTETELQFIVGRRATTGFVEIENLYDRVYTYQESAIRVSYPDVVIRTWPAQLVPGEAFTIEGDNVDLITSVSINGQSVSLPTSTETSKIVVPTAGLVIVPGETAIIKLTALGQLNEDEKADIPIEMPSDLFDAMAPIILWDFESGAPNMEEVENMPAQADLNLGNVSKARGENYYSVLHPGETSGWKTYFIIKYGQSVDLSTFHEPHLTFLVNTNGKRGYVNPFMTQDGERKDNHLTDGNADENLKYGDNYVIQTEGWEWRSYPISKLFADFNPLGVFDDVEIRFITGNVANGDVNPEDFEIHIDQIMITDGAVNPAAKVFDFEGAEPTFEEDVAGTSHGYNLTGVGYGSGENYYSLTSSIAKSWNWMGAIGNYNSVDLSAMIDPHFSMLINTGEHKGMIQIELYQNETKWGGSVDVVNYYLESDGWTPISVRLADVLGNWGGDATEFDPTASVDYVKIGFTTGNLESGTYEISIDDVYISDGPMW